MPFRVIFEPQLDESRGDLRLHFKDAYSILETAISDRAFPGCAFGVLLDGRVVLEDALGKFTYDQNAPSVSTQTLFDVASLTKVIATTAAAMLLHQRGVLDLEMPVGELLPGFVIGREASEHARKVTVRHLLAHSSGLPGYVPLFHAATSPSEIVRGCLNLPIQAEPGTRAEYSDPGFILLGKAIEALTGESLATFVHREVAIPLGLTHTGFCPPNFIRHEIPPTEEDELFRQRQIQGEVQDEHAYVMKGVAGHAGIFSNVPDLLRFSQAILEPDTYTLFRPETVQLFSQRQLPLGSSRALGWDTPSVDSSSGSFFAPESIGHLGYSGCSLWIDRKSGIAIVLLTNRTWPHRESQKIRIVRPLFHDAIRSIA